MRKQHYCTLLVGSGSTQICINARILSHVFERLKGLLMTNPETSPVLLERCNSIHTYGMTYPIDVMFVSEQGVIVRSERALPPMRCVEAKGASWVLERPATCGRWPGAGERVMREEERGMSASSTKHDGCPPASPYA